MDVPPPEPSFDCQKKPSPSIAWFPHVTAVSCEQWDAKMKDIAVFTTSIIVDVRLQPCCWLRGTTAGVRGANGCQSLGHQLFTPLIFCGAVGEREIKRDQWSKTFPHHHKSHSGYNLMLTVLYTVEPRHNEPQFNKIRNVTDFFHLPISSPLKTSILFFAI